MSRHTVFYGKREIGFDLIRKDVKNINLNIRPDLTISVSASEEVPLEVIKEFVTEKGSWINKNMKYFQEFQPHALAPKEYVSGESFKYLGRQYRLKVKQSEVEEVEFFRRFICLHVKDTKDTERKEALLNAWFEERAEYHFQSSLERMYKLVKKYDILKPVLKIREMKTRWGSCHRENATIILNSDLIAAPKHCIDYVVLHELIHFKYKNHDGEFHTFLTSLMPDWEQRKRILDEEIVREL